MKDDPTLIGIDDLHPTPRGYDVMAGVFFEGIRTHFENRPAAAWRDR
jgi:lysophospholipase L1-like esterase